MVTAFGKFLNNSCIKDTSWIPASLRWAAGEDREYIDTIRKFREERNIIPHRPYFFNLGYVSTDKPDNFNLDQIATDTGQDWNFPPGKYCFEITITGEEIRSPIKKYYIVEWKGGCIDDFNVVKGKLTVSENQRAPW